MGKGDKLFYRLKIFSKKPKSFLKQFPHATLDFRG